MKIALFAIVLFPLCARASGPDVVSLKTIRDDYQLYSGSIVLVAGSLFYGFEHADFKDSSITSREFPVSFDWDAIALRRAASEPSRRFLQLVEYAGLQNSRGEWKIGSGTFRVFVQISEPRMKARSANDDPSNNDRFSGFGHMGQSDAHLIIVEVVSLDSDPVVLSLSQKPAQPGATDNPDDAQRLREDH